MAQAQVYSGSGTKQDKAATLESAVFGVQANHQLLSTAYNSYLANRRAAGPSTLTRGEVRGGGRKPWRQKGTGRARAGSTRLPHWTGGGVAFGPTGHENFQINLPVKAKRAAIRQALSLKAADKRIAILEAFDGGDGKVKATAQLFSKLELQGNILLVVSAKTDVIGRATRNLAGVTVATATYLNVFTVLNSDWIVMTKDAHEAVSNWLGAKS